MRWEPYQKTSSANVLIVRIFVLWIAEDILILYIVASEEEINQVIEQEQMAQMQAEQEAMMQEQMPQMLPAEAQEVPQEMPQEMPDEELSVEEEELVMALGQRGFNEEQIQIAVTAMRQGMPT